MPPASITTSAASTAAAGVVPTSAIRSPSMRMVSPAAKGSRQSPETICPRLTIAIFMKLSSVSGARQFALQIVRRQQRIHQPGRILPVKGAEAVAASDKAGAGIEHFVLRMPRTEFGADRVPCRLEKFDFLLRLHRGRS